MYSIAIRSCTCIYNKLSGRMVSVGFMKGMSSFTIEYGLSPVMMMTGSVLSCINSVIFLQNV